jgi:hypothetical protein
MTQVVVFLGPTLAVDEARAVLDAEYLPPVAHGDVLRATLGRPRAIAIVDGVFERVPAVWHKEILFALSEGIHVYGAASMGALRAAELDRFGMRGVGEIYRAYADGSLEDDDEVAVAHGDAEDGFRAVSDAMVDGRATLEAAVAQRIVTEDTAAAIASRVKATFYPRRLLLGALDPEDGDHERLRAWLPEGRVQRKRDDALALLRVVHDDLEAELEPFRPTWVLQNSHYWADARRAITLAAEHAPSPGSALEALEELDAVLDEIRLEPHRYHRLLDDSLLSALARDAATAHGVDTSVWAQQGALDRERDHLGLLEPDDVVAWLEQRSLSDADLPAVARRLAVLRWAQQAHRHAVADEVALGIRFESDYAELADRAARKRQVLASQPAVSLEDREVISWYFHERIGQDVPVVLDAWASAHGWRQVGDLVRALRAEWSFERSLGPQTRDRSSA